MHAWLLNYIPNTAGAYRGYKKDTIVCHTFSMEIKHLGTVSAHTRLKVEGA